MAKLFSKLSKNQAVAFLICILLILVTVGFGIIIRLSYPTVSLDESSYPNAKVSFTEESSQRIDFDLLSLDFEKAKMALDEYNSVFTVECLETEHCFNCTKYICKVTKTIKNDVDETDKNIVIYQWNFFDMNGEDEFSFVPIDDRMPLKPNNEYLVFTVKKDYCSEYLETLECNEYSLGLNVLPVAFVLDNQQSRFVDINKDSVFSSLDDINYLCFSKEALININHVSEQVIDYYTNLV